MKTVKIAFALVCLSSMAAFAHGQSITLLLNSKTIEGVGNGASLSAWTGEVGSATTPGSLTAPTYQASSTIAGMPAVRFDANHFTSGQGMGMVTSLTQSSGAYTVISIYNHRDTSNADTNIRRVLNGGDGVNFDALTGPNWLIGPYGEEHRHYANGWVTLPGPSANTGPALVTAINTGIGSGTSNFWVDGNLETDNSSFNGAFDVLGLGVAGRHGEAADSDLGLVLVFDDVLSVDQRVGVEFIVAEAFGLTGFFATEEQIEAGNALLAGTSFNQVPEPTSIAVWLLLALTTCGFGFGRLRRK